MHVGRILSEHRVVIVLFLLFLVANSIYLHRVPGLLGDEGSEGENVYQLQQAFRDKQAGEQISNKVFVLGERSYIGPLPDYVRIPFTAMFGYTALALRVPLLIISVLTFWLALRVFTTSFGHQAGTLAATAMLFSPAYLTYQRLGWAITVLPFFALLLIRLLQGRVRHKALLVGLVAGLGLHIHILFLPTLIAIIVMALTNWKLQKLKTLWQQKIPFVSGARQMLREALAWWPALIGFMAGFGTQLVMLAIDTDDQGVRRDVWGEWFVKTGELPSVLQDVLSGSAFFARYIGNEFSSTTNTAFFWFLIVLVLLGLVLSSKRGSLLLWLAGLAIHLAALLYIIEAFSLRYLVIFCLGAYVVAGHSFGSLLEKVKPLAPRFRSLAPIGLALLLLLFTSSNALVPFLTTSGSVDNFSIGPKTDSASGLVATDKLLACVRGAGKVSSENVHIFNRLQFFSRQFSDVELVPDDQLSRSTYLVHYRLPSKIVPENSELCPSLKFFIVERKK